LAFLEPKKGPGEKKRESESWPLVGGHIPLGPLGRGKRKTGRPLIGMGGKKKKE